MQKYLRSGYFEPFLGGGAVFFGLRPGIALLSDINSELVDVYRAVRDSPGRIVAILKRMPVTAQYYYRVRRARFSSDAGNAARFLFLNRTAFGGIYRLNALGQFNVPFGHERTPEILWARRLIETASAALQGVEVVHRDFECVMDESGSGDVVYCDPTYTVTHERNGFIRYNEANFSWADQERLATAARRAARRGATVVVSNAYHNVVRKLFAPPHSLILHRPSCVSRDPEARREVREYLFVFPGREFVPARAGKVASADP
jgi:DNA adenine methylase